MIRVLIATASVVVRAGLAAIVTTNQELTVVSSESGLTALTQQIDNQSPDVVLLELGLQDDEAMLEKLLGLDGISSDSPAFVVLADDLQGDWAESALRKGVRGVLPRSATAGDILAAVEAAAAGLVVVHPDLLDSLLPVLPSIPRTLPASPLQALTPREIEVLGMMAEGLGNKTIARRLNISEHTVKFHVSSILTKLNASSRTEAVTLGARQGLIML